MNQDVEFEKSRSGAMWFGGAVYVGVVLAASTLFVSFILTAFPADAYFSQVVMTLAGLLVGASMLAFPVALHNWAISGVHRTVTVVLYYLEMAIVALNTVVSFGSLLAKYAGYQLPEWVSMYEPFSVISIVFTLAAWGTVFQLDPSSKAREKDLLAQQIFKQKVAAKKLEFLDSVEGEDAILNAAQFDIEKQFGGGRPTGEARHFGRSGGAGGLLVQPVTAARLSAPGARDDEPVFRERVQESVAAPFSGNGHKP